MFRASAVAFCGALLSLASSAGAQVTLTERGRLQGGFISEKRPGLHIEDLHIGVIPELSALWATRRTQLSVSYAFTGTLHTVYANELANQVNLSGAFELSPRTTLVVSAFAAQTSLNNFLLTQPTTATATTVFPTGESNIVTGNVAQGLSHELSPRVRFEQQATTTVFTTLAPTPPLDAFNTTLGAAIERSWVRDALGGETSVGYSRVQAAPPTPSQEFIIGTAAPRWRRDWSATVSSLVAAGISGLVSPAGQTDPLLAPFGRGTLLYTPGDTSVDLTISTGLTPNPLTGQTLQAHQVLLHAITPLSRQARVFLGASAGYIRGKLVDRLTPQNSNDFDTALSDVEVTWQPNGYLRLFARYTFIGQISDTNALGFNPSFLRDSLLLGLAVSSTPVDASPRRGGGFGGRGEVSTRLPQRVDRTDRGAGLPPERQPPLGGEGRPRTEEDGRSRWIYTTPARPPQEDDDR